MDKRPNIVKIEQMPEPVIIGHLKEIAENNQEQYVVFNAHKIRDIEFIEYVGTKDQMMDKINFMLNTQQVPFDSLEVKKAYYAPSDLGGFDTDVFELV